ncbi:MAG TPA: hypothetical protein VFE66_00920 [Bacteroidales bacterium]|nr:hypothetical protein [Bacteroidales bacterium]
MKRCFTLLAVMLFTVASWAQNADYLLKKDFQSEKKKISEGIDAAKKTGIDAKKIATKQVTALDSLAKTLAANEKALAQTNDSLQKNAARFNDLEARVNKSSINTQNSVLVAVIVFAVLFLLLFALVFFLKRNSNEKVRELSEENMRLGESVKQESVLMKEELKKSADSLSLTLHEYSANFSAKIEQSEEKQRAFATELEEVVDKVVKEQALQKSRVDEQFKELLSKVNTEKTEHKSLHEKIESEVKGLRSLHVKDVEEIKAKL